MSANERQVGGSHYKVEEGEEEHWDRVARLGLDYFQGQITKYVERCWLKGGIYDLEKALHFIQKYIEVSKAQGRKGARQEAEVTLKLDTTQVQDALDTARKVIEEAEAKIASAREGQRKSFERLQHVLATAVMREDGLFEFDDHTRLPCLRGKSNAVSDGSEPGAGYVNQDGPHQPPPVPGHNPVG